MGFNEEIILGAKPDRRREIIIICSLTIIAVVLSIILGLQNDLPKILLVFIIEIFMAIPFYMCFTLYYNRRVKEVVKHFIILLLLGSIGIITAFLLTIYHIIRISIKDWSDVFLFDSILLATYNAMIFPILLKVISSWLKPKPIVPMPDFKRIKKGQTYDYADVWSNWFKECQSKLELYKTWNYLSQITTIFSSKIKELFEDKIASPQDSAIKIPLADYALEYLLTRQITEWNDIGWIVGFRGFRETLREVPITDRDFNLIITILEDLRSFISKQTGVFQYSKEYYYIFEKQLKDMIEDLKIFQKNQSGGRI